nr:hypothetical protein [Sunxiuqinia sp.]
MKYRQKEEDGEMREDIKSACLAVGKKDEIKFAEIGTDENQAHFFLQW